MYKYILSTLIVFLIGEKIYSATWTKTFGGSGWDVGYAVESITDGSYVLVGCTNSFGEGESDVWLLKVDTNGNLLWSKTFGGLGNDGAYSMCCTEEGGYIITGFTESFGANGKDIWLIKTDEDGNMVWSKTFNESEEDCGYCVRQTMDSCYIITGYTKLSGVENVLLIKTDADGDSIWYKRFIISNGAFGLSVCQTPDGGYMITGKALRYSHWPYYRSLFIMRNNEIGDSLWVKTFESDIGGSVGNCIQQTMDGNYIITGSIVHHLFLMKIDGNGDTLWINRFLPSQHGSMGYFVEQTQDSGYIMVARGHGRIRLMKTDNEGELQWDNTFGIGFELGNCVRETNDKGYIIVGYTRMYPENTIPDLWLIRSDPVYGIEEAFVEDQYSETFILYPNPATSYTQVKLLSGDNQVLNLALYDITGRRIQTLFNYSLTPGEDNTFLDLSKVDAGIYFLEMKTNKRIIKKKIVVVK